MDVCILDTDVKYFWTFWHKHTPWILSVMCGWIGQRQNITPKKEKKNVPSLHPHVPASHDPASLHCGVLSPWVPAFPSLHVPPSPRCWSPCPHPHFSDSPYLGPSVQTQGKKFYLSAVLVMTKSLRVGRWTCDKSWIMEWWNRNVGNIAKKKKEQFPYPLMPTGCQLSS